MFFFLYVICYAKKAEKQYPNVLPYRLRQQEYWNNTTAPDFVANLVQSYSNYLKKGKIKYLRFNESGDMANVGDLIKLNEIAKLLKDHNIVVYTYTAIKDILFNRYQELYLSSNLSITLSNVKNDNFNT